MNRKWLYHKDCPGGKIFDGDDDPGDGWVDTPDKLNEPVFNPDAIVMSTDDELVEDPSPRGRKPKAK